MKKLGLALLLFAWVVAPAQAQVGPVPQVSISTNIRTYAAADVNVANTGTGDAFCIYGSATKTIAIDEIHSSATATAAIVVNSTLNKYSSTPTGGTAVTETDVPLDSSNAAGTASVKSYSVSPTSGTLVGAIGAHKMAIGVQGNSAAMTEHLHYFGNIADQPVILHGTSQGVCLTVGAAGAGASWAFYVRWTEY